MAEPTPVNGVNDAPAKTQQVTITCNELWSSAQQFSYRRLSDRKSDGTYKLIGLYAARARRISATYARFYLETEDGGDPSKKGRYYWMALGAFASKTVACLLDGFQLNASYFMGKATFGGIDGHNIANGLGQGNLWLFGDIAPAHWFYSHYPHHFFNGMDCIHKRHCDRLVEPVKSHVKALPWSGKSLGKIKYFEASPDLIEGFEYVVQIEQMAPSPGRRAKQMEHLLVIADHEQGAVLQPLIYEDPDFSKWTKRERSPWIRWMSPTYELVFSHECSTGDTALKSVAPDDLEIENFRSRMAWIRNAAEKFHGLMETKTSYMEAELRTMAGWKNSADALLVY
jgi:hypothetical protein